MFKDQLVYSGIAFAAGVAVLQQLPQLLPAYSYLILILVPGLWWWRPWLAPVCVFIIGFLWAMLCAQLRLANELPRELISKDIIASGVVVSIPEKDQQRVRFEFQIQEQESKSDVIKLNTPVTTRLSWYKVKGNKVPDLHIGQKWRLCIRLKPPIGFMNPGGFDYEGWLFSRNIRATGYIRALRKSDDGTAIASLRSFGDQGRFAQSPVRFN
jgi:competence protein ComEC